MHIEKSDLRTKNAKAGHLFASRHRNRRAVAIGFFLLAACVSAIPLQYANVSEKREKAETALKKNQEEPVAIRGYSFWQLFEGQIKAIRESEGHIDKYTFDRNATPQTTIQLTDANPELLEERMERDDRCAKFRFGDILFSGGSQRFSLSIESAARKETGNTAARYQDIVRFSDFIAAQEGIAESIRMNKQPRYAYRLESSRLACFIHALREFCLDNGIIPAVLSIALDRSSGTCMLTTELAYGSAVADSPSAFPTQGEIAEAFLPRNDRDRIVPSRGTTNREPDGVLVGMIAFNGKKVTFDRKKDGKISVNRTGNEE